MAVCAVPENTRLAAGIKAIHRAAFFSIAHFQILHDKNISTQTETKERNVTSKWKKEGWFVYPVSRIYEPPLCVCAMLKASVSAFIFFSLPFLMLPSNIQTDVLLWEISYVSTRNRIVVTFQILACKAADLFRNTLEITGNPF